MGRVEKIKVDRVICDEIFYVSATKEEVEFNLPQSTSLGDAPVIQGTVTVGILECDLIEEEEQVVASVVFMVQEEIMVTPGGDGAEGDPIELEYGFRLLKELPFQKCQIPEGLSLNDIRCQIFRLEVDGRIDNLQLTEDPTIASFDNIIEIMVKIKVVEEIQTFVAAGTTPNVVIKLLVLQNIVHFLF